ncbi:MAG TPA: flagellar basal body P-ring formation chaperone FlgA [Vicinamibacterales bacterium]|nr:flagellar basal body P-ring formation chaperone FlgA [Vicinamibacterales bacterium]
MLILLLTLAAAEPLADTPEMRVREAITAAVRARMGAGATVSIDTLTIESNVDGPAVQAVPEPGSKLGRAIRFILRSSDMRARTGSATALVRVSVGHAHTTRALERGVAIADGDIVPASHDIAGAVLRPLPTLRDAAQARTVRPLAAGACITAPAIAALPAVRGGQEVVAVVRFGGVEARTIVTASQSGEAGSIIRVVNRQSQRPLKARVVSEGLVEIIHD